MAKFVLAFLESIPVMTACCMLDVIPRSVNPGEKKVNLSHCREAAEKIKFS